MANRNFKKIYYWGFLGLVPNIGLISGIILLIRGIRLYNDKTLITIGIASILFTPVFWLSFKYWTENSYTWDIIYAESAQDHLNTLVMDLEYFKKEREEYPISLIKLKAEIQTSWIIDPFSSKNPDNSTNLFYYRRIDSTYYLFSSGIDRVPHTNDDIHPEIHLLDFKDIGLIIQK